MTGGKHSQLEHAARSDVARMSAISQNTDQFRLCGIKEFLPCSEEAALLCSAALGCTALSCAVQRCIGSSKAALNAYVQVDWVPPNSLKLQRCWPLSPLTILGLVNCI
jgi:hypothetical protein